MPERGVTTGAAGLLIIISSPSGAGKSTLCQRLLRDSREDIWMSISSTTRQKRSSEVEGQDYRFVARAQFEKMVARGEFLEHAEVFGNLYGTPREPVEDKLESGTDVLFDIDWQGANQIRDNVTDHRVVSIFILPPSMEALEERLRHRAQDDEETVRFRMSRARQEIENWADYEYVLVNDDLETCLRQLKSVITAERIKQRKAGHVAALAARLLK